MKLHEIKNEEILINRMYAGSYLENEHNIGHEVINLIRADGDVDENGDGRNYIYVQPYGTMQTMKILLNTLIKFSIFMILFTLQKNISIVRIIYLRLKLTKNLFKKYQIAKVLFKCEYNKTMNKRLIAIGDIHGGNDNSNYLYTYKKNGTLVDSKPNSIGLLGLSKKS